MRMLVTLYCSFLRFFLKFGDIIPQYSALLVLTILLTFNLYSLVVIVDLFIGENTLFLFLKKMGLASFAAILAFNIFYFFGKKGKMALKRCMGNSRRGIKERMFVLIYVLGSVFFFIYELVYLSSHPLS